MYHEKKEQQLDKDMYTIFHVNAIPFMARKVLLSTDRKALDVLGQKWVRCFVSYFSRFLVKMGSWKLGAHFKGTQPSTIPCRVYIALREELCWKLHVEKEVVGGTREKVYKSNLRENADCV